MFGCNSWAEIPGDPSIILSSYLCPDQCFSPSLKGFSNVACSYHWYNHWVDTYYIYFSTIIIIPTPSLFFVSSSTGKNKTILSPHGVLLVKQLCHHTQYISVYKAMISLWRSRSSSSTHRDSSWPVEHGWRQVGLRKAWDMLALFRKKWKCIPQQHSQAKMQVQQKHPPLYREAVWDLQVPQWASESILVLRCQMIGPHSVLALPQGYWDAKHQAPMSPGPPHTVDILIMHSPGPQF